MKNRKNLLDLLILALVLGALIVLFNAAKIQAEQDDMKYVHPSSIYDNR
jgi:hypothetical protein